MSPCTPSAQTLRSERTKGAQDLHKPCAPFLLGFMASLRRRLVRLMLPIPILPIINLRHHPHWKLKIEIGNISQCFGNPTLTIKNRNDRSTPDGTSITTSDRFQLHPQLFSTRPIVNTFKHTFIWFAFFFVNKSRNNLKPSFPVLVKEFCRLFAIDIIPLKSANRDYFRLYIPIPDNSPNNYVRYNLY